MIASPFGKGRVRGISKSPFVPLYKRGKLKAGCLRGAVISRVFKRGAAPLPKTSPSPLKERGTKGVR